MTSRKKVICGCECFISAKSMYFYLITWRYHCLKHHKDISHTLIFETYKNEVRPHGCHI